MRIHLTVVRFHLGSTSDSSNKSQHPGRVYVSKCMASSDIKGITEFHKMAQIHPVLSSQYAYQARLIPAFGCRWDYCHCYHHLSTARLTVDADGSHIPSEHWNPTPIRAGIVTTTASITSLITGTEDLNVLHSAASPPPFWHLSRLQPSGGSEVALPSQPSHLSDEAGVPATDRRRPPLARDTRSCVCPSPR